MSTPVDQGELIIEPQPNMFKRLWAVRQRISVRLYLAFGLATLITLIASILAIVAINLVAGAQAEVNENNVPKLLRAFTAAQLSSELVGALPRMTASTSTEEFSGVVLDVNTTTDKFIQELNELKELYTDDEAIKQIQDNGTQIQTNIDQVQELVTDRFRLMARGEAIIEQAQDLLTEANGILIPAIDNQLFYAMTSYRLMEGMRAESPQELSSVAVDEYRHLVTIQTSIVEAIRALTSVWRVDSFHQVPPLSQEFDAAINRIKRSSTYITTMGEQTALQEVLDKVSSLGHDEQNSFAARTSELELIDQLTFLVNFNEGLVSDLVSQMEELVNTAEQETDASTALSERVAYLTEIVLIAYNVLTITGAILLAWLWVGRQLINRIARLSGSMQTMANGNLEVEIDQSGADEVAHMANALEVFRKHALEVQRLNLVEKLAEELAEKNETLEQTNVQLKRAQNQIVMQEKLAALGELTAGVAHEIKNPMNFIINFSDVSKELIEELIEEIDGTAKEEDEKDEIDKEYLQEICDDLTSNLERISNHGQRANRIVVDMLSMGRGSSDWRPTDLNELIDTHINLAFHSQRGQDSDFQLKMDFELDDSIGNVNVVPQDLGRVFLNITTNACHATDEKRQKIREETGSDDEYMPTLTVRSRKCDDHLEIEFEDNGPGMSEEVIEKIFQPFFTTKDPNSGTGLGMSLSHDIIRQHGGEISIRSELGKGSSLTVHLPLDPSISMSADEGAEDEEEDELNESA